MLSRVIMAGRGQKAEHLVNRENRFLYGIDAIGKILLMSLSHYLTFKFLLLHLVQMKTSDSRRAGHSSKGVCLLPPLLFPCHIECGWCAAIWTLIFPFKTTKCKGRTENRAYPTKVIGVIQQNFMPLSVFLGKIW